MHTALPDHHDHMHACLASEWLLVLCEPHAALYVVICYVKVALWGVCMLACMVEASCIMQTPCRGQPGICTVGRKDLVETILACMQLMWCCVPHRWGEWSARQFAKLVSEPVLRCWTCVLEPTGFPCVDVYICWSGGSCSHCL